MPRVYHSKKIASLIESRLRSIYEEDGKLPDLSRLDRGHRRFSGTAIVALLFLAVLVGTAWVGFLLFAPFTGKPAPRLTISVVPPAQVFSLEETTLRVHYENTSNAALTNTELRMNIPPEFILKSAKPTPTTGPATWLLGSLDPREDGVIELKGMFIAKPTTPTLFQSFMRYRPSNFNADFDDVATTTIPVDGSKLKLALEAPAETISGEPTTITYRVKNEGSEKIEKITVKTTLPESFIISKSEPKAREGIKDTFDIAELPPGGEASIVLTGSFAATHEASENLKGTVEITRNDLTTTQDESMLPIRVTPSDVSFRTVVNGSSEAQSADFGTGLRLGTFFKNNSDKQIKDVSMTITIDATPDAMIDWAAFDKATEADKTFKRDGEKIIINKKLRKELSAIAPGVEDAVNYTIPLVKTAPDTKLASISITSIATIGTIGDKDVAKTVQTLPVAVSMNSDLAAKISASYFDSTGAPLGSGPLPPVVGEKTKYLVRWEISNSMHELHTISMTAKLPEGVAWGNAPLAEAGTITWNSLTNEVKWQLARLPTATKKVNVQFTVELTPQKSHIGTFAPILSDTTLFATDAITGTPITRITGPLTTEIPNDTHAAGKGTITAAQGQ